MGFNINLEIDKKRGVFIEKNSSLEHYGFIVIKHCIFGLIKLVMRYVA